MIRRLPHTLLAMALASTLTVGLPTRAAAEPIKDVGTALGAESTTSALTPSSTSSVLQPAAEKLWLSRLNAVRSQFGAPAVVENTTMSAAAWKHSRFMAENGVVTHSEDADLPWYSPDGNTAGINSLVASGWSTESEFIDAWAASPFHLISMLHTGLASSGYGQYRTAAGETAATLNVLQGRTKAQLTTGWPRTWPRGTTTIRELSDASSPDPAAGCAAPAGSWYGTASLVDFGPGATVTSATATLLEDGSPIPVCVRVASNYADPTAKALMAGKILVIPHRPLALNKGYTGTVTTNLGTAALRFDTGNPASGVYGDHTGDGKADLLAVRSSDQALMLHQTAAGPTLRPGVQVGSSWGGMNWISNVYDLNNDSRTELIARRSDSTLWIYRGLGRGQWASGAQIGRGFGGLDQLTVLSDVTGDKRPELIGRAANGDLIRYSFSTLTGTLTNTRVIGTGWGGMVRIFSPGDFSGDGIPDVMAIGANGLLYSYEMNATGGFKAARIVGRGWAGWTAAWSPGDLDGDGRPDLIGRRSDGNLYFYANRGTSWGPATLLGTGWNSARLLA